ncbi:UNVERIFIED_CONTAM: hypothetical protein KB576_10730, partial [Streptococcus canis]
FQHGFGQYGRAGGKIVNRIKRHDAALILNNNPPDFRLAAGFVQGWKIPVLRPILGWQQALCKDGKYLSSARFHAARTRKTTSIY